MADPSQVVAEMPDPVVLLTELINGSVIVWVLGGLVSIVGALVGMYFRQKRIWRDIYGDKDDQTRTGVLKEHQDSNEAIIDQLDRLERNTDHHFAHLERQMTSRHAELAYAVSRIIDDMDDPPGDVRLQGPLTDEQDYVDWSEWADRQNGENPYEYYSDGDYDGRPWSDRYNDDDD